MIIPSPENTWKYLISHGHLGMIPRIFNFLLGIIFPGKIFLHKNGRRNPESPLDSSLLGKFLTKTYGFSLRILTNFRNFEGTSPWHVFFGKLWMTLANFSSKIIQWIFQRSHSIPYFKDKHIRRTIFYQIWYSKFQIYQNHLPETTKTTNFSRFCFASTSSVGVCCDCGAEGWNLAGHDQFWVGEHMWANNFSLLYL